MKTEDADKMLQKINDCEKATSDLIIKLLNLDPNKKYTVNIEYMKTDLEKFKELFDSCQIEYELKESDDEFEMFISNDWAYVSITFTKEGKNIKFFVSDY